MKTRVLGKFQLGRFLDAVNKELELESFEYIIATVYLFHLFFYQLIIDVFLICVVG